MPIGSVFINNCTQAVQLPREVRFPASVHMVEIRARGSERIISPVGQTWESFFLGGLPVSEDFMTKRSSQQQQPKRESL